MSMMKNGILWGKIVFWLCLALLAPLVCCGEVQAVLAVEDSNYYYVATTGNDSTGDGALTNPWRTIQYGVNRIAPGDTLFIREGVYNEALTIPANKSGSAASHTVIAAYAGETPVISGSSGSRIRMTNVSYITIQGLTLTGGNYGVNYDTTVSRPAAGLDNVYILDNTIRDIDGSNSICVYNQAYRSGSTTNTSALRNVIISGNNIAGGRSGSTETVVINGNIDGFTVSGNIIRNSNNIGVDFIGFEGNNTYWEVDQARNGKVFNNIVFGVSVINNNAYWENSSNRRPFGGQFDRCCAGVYVDGGKDIEIYHNLLFDNDIGCEVATEHTAITATEIERFVVSGVQVHDNIIASSNGWGPGLVFGGYNSDLGYTKDCVFANNILYGNITGIVVQKSANNTIWGNIISEGGEALGFMSATERNANNFEDNLWYNGAANSNSYYASLNRLPEAQLVKQIKLVSSPLADPVSGDFSPLSPYGGLYGTIAAAWADWPHDQPPFELYVSYAKARAELAQAKAFLESVKFDFLAAGEAGDLKSYLTAQLQANGYPNSEALYILRTASADANIGLGLNDPSGSAQIVTLTTGANNGHINAANLNNVYDGLAVGASKEYAYLVQVITRYEGGYTSEATESNNGGVRMFLERKPISSILPFSGKLLYQDSPRPATVELFNSQGEPIYAMTTAEDGAYTLLAPAGAGYTLVITKPGYLSYTIKNLTLTEGEDIETIDLYQLAGDINGDGFVNSEDLVCLISEFGRAPINYQYADIDGDGLVNSVDLTCLLAGFGKWDVVVDRAIND